MKLILAAAACAALAFSASAVDAKGCLKGAAVGGVAGHVMGHHALAGAAVGCAVGHHQATKKARAAQATAAQSAPTPKR
jgi:hypothetical protein